MEILSAIDWFLNVLNDALDIALPWVVLAGLVAYIVFFLVTNFRRRQADITRGSPPRNTVGEIINQSLLLVVMFSVFAVLFWFLPRWLGTLPGASWVEPSLRWGEFFLVVFMLARYFGHRNGGRRWFFTSLLHAGVIFLGWMVDYWLGIIFISLPLLAMFYLGLGQLAGIILPTSNPEDQQELRRRAVILVSYAWGFQSPLVTSGTHSWQEPVTRVAGTYNRLFNTPGLIWTKAHELVGVTGDNLFRRVAGPGLVFTARPERPFQFVDLRLQLRIAEINVVSRDGLSFKANVFTSFRIDPERWDDDLFSQLRTRNPNLETAQEVVADQGSYPFSAPRVLAALGTTVSRVTLGEPLLYWDRWAVSVIESVTRRIIAQRNLDEFWLPAQGQNGDNALFAISREIRAEAIPQLRAAGILLVAARITNFSFPTDNGRVDRITQQNIASWGSEWARRRAAILDEARAESDRTQQEARAYAESILLSSIAEGLKKAGELSAELPKYVIAQRFMNALQDFIHKQPGTEAENPEAQKKIAGFQAYLRDLQGNSFPGGEREGKS